MPRLAWAGVFFFLLTVVVAYVDFQTGRETWTVGSITTRNETALVSLTNSMDILTDNRYDSYQSPRGVNYQTPAGVTLYIGYLMGTPDTAGSTAVHVRIGYGDEAVSDSLAAPTNAVIVWDASFENPANMSNPRSVWIPIPENKYPFLQLTPGGSVQAVGIER